MLVVVGFLLAACGSGDSSARPDGSAGPAAAPVDGSPTSASPTAAPQQTTPTDPDRMDSEKPAILIDAAVIAIKPPPRGP
jgi:hypothetical protein